MEHIVDHRETPDWVDTVREMSGGGVDVAWDAVGGDAFHQVRRCMAWDGRLLIVGFVGGIAQAPNQPRLVEELFDRRCALGGIADARPGECQASDGAVFELAADGLVAPPVESVRPFEEAAAVIQAIADRQVTGKAVVTI